MFGDSTNALNIDLYELTMSQVYWRRGMDSNATFSLFFRGYPPNRAFYLACGIDHALQYLKDFHFTDEEIIQLNASQSLSADFVDHLAGLTFDGSIRAVPEGTIVFANEPLIEVTAPIIQAQLVETMLLNIVTSASLFATKATRIVKAADSRSVVDFGSRRAHSVESAIIAARSAYIAGFDGTSNVRAAASFGIPAVGTMAHSFVQAFEEESEAFQTYAAEFPDATTLLVDTYDILRGIENAVKVGLHLGEQGKKLGAIRLDSGDLAHWSREARTLLDSAGLTETRIIASGGLDEHSVSNLTTADAPIDAFGVGTRFTTSADAPYIDSVYKLVELDGRPIFKTSEGKETLPWAKQVYRIIEDDAMQRDVITRAISPPPLETAQPLMQSVMRDGNRLASPESLETVRSRVKQQLSQLPVRHQHLTEPERYPVETAADIVLRR